MADIDLRFHKDMLVLSAPVAPALERLGIDAERDGEFTLLLECDTVEDVCRLEMMAGAQCLVAPTATLTPARLTRVNMEDRAQDLADAALEVAHALNPQHILVEIGPCGLPLDASSKSSLNENLDQYARAGRLFAGARFDAFFLNGFATTTDLKCALMGLRKVSDAPVFASVDVRADGVLASGRGTIEEAAAVMDEYGAAVAGLRTGAPQQVAAVLAGRLAAASCLPLLAQLSVAERDERQEAPTDANPYYIPDTMVDAAAALRAAGVQFLRAVGDATPAYTGALVAAVLGLDAQDRAFVPAPEAPGAQAAAGAPAAAAGAAGVSDDMPAGAAAAAEDVAALVAAARARVTAAIGGNLDIISSDGPSIEE